MENKGYPEVNLDSWIKVGEGGNGVTYEHPDKPERLEEMAQLFCEQGRILFSTPCDTSVFPSKKALFMACLTSARNG